MTLDSYRMQQPQPPPPPQESSFSRQNPWLGSFKSEIKGQTNKLAKDARRRRVELRRIRSFSQAVSVADPPLIDVDHLVDLQNEGTPMDLKVERGASRRSHGKISVVGRRRKMEDAVTVELGFLKRGGERYDFFGVFDGRGGRRVARARSQMLHLKIADIVEESRKEREWEEVMREGFHVVEAKVHDNGAAAVLIGSAAVVGEKEVVVAGNSKAVLCREGVAVRLLEAAKGGQGEGERERQVQVRVAVRRCEDEFLILGSDGFWEAISDEVACEVPRRYCDGGGGVEAAAALMAALAVAQGSKHNVSVILVDLRSSGDKNDNGTPTSSV